MGCHWEMSWAAPASLQLPASSMQPVGAQPTWGPVVLCVWGYPHYAGEKQDEGEQEAEDRVLAEKCGLLRARLRDVPEEDLQFVLDMLTSQLRETWALRRALANKTEEGGQRGQFQLRIFEAEARMARQEENMEAELCAELVQEAKALAAQADSWRREPREARYAHWEEAALRLPVALKTEAALRNRAAVLNEEEMQLQAQVGEWQRHSAAELLACRFEVSDLQRQNGELRGELVQAQAELLPSQTGGLRGPAAAGSAERAAQDAPGRRVEQSEAQPRQTGASAAVRWHDAGSVFDAFASNGGDREQMFPVDFGHLCERLRRAQGRGPSTEQDRRDFAHFAFSAVFGAEASVDRGTFARLFPHFALMLNELEEAYVAAKAQS
ncbi:unnamed protein product [Effrenium voratum]|nr:unnamed protein product [Effrenium voratum]